MKAAFTCKQCEAPYLATLVDTRFRVVERSCQEECSATSDELSLHAARVMEVAGDDEYEARQKAVKHWGTSRLEGVMDRIGTRLYELPWGHPA